MSAPPNPPSEERLGDYVDGLLNKRETRQVERALDASAEARSMVAFLRSLRSRTAQLPDAIEPGRDLWAGIAARMAPAPLASVGTKKKTPLADDEPVPHRAWLPLLDGFQWATLGAAAVLLMATSAALTAWMLTVPGGEDVANAAELGATPAAESGLENIRPAEAAFALEIEQLMRVLHEHRDTLDPDTVSTIETNLRVVNRAIDRAREALEEDPASPGLARMLTNNYRHKLQLLQRANRIIELS